MMKTMCGDYVFVQSPETLQALLHALDRHETVALDTEADSMHHYREKLCLIQLGLGEQQYIVDPLCGLDVEPLVRRLEHCSLLLHGADYDLRLLYKAYEFRPRKIFDTMIAAQLLGKQRFGLAVLVQEICEVVLTKENQKADWSIRPLTGDMLRYAADDTRYLARVSAELHRELKLNGRLAWHEEACERLIGITQEPRQASDEDAWRIKGGKHLHGRPGAVLRELWQWREELARDYDRPPFKVANGEFLLQYALWVADNPQGTFHEAPERPAWLRGSKLKGFETALERGLALEPREWPRPRVSSGPGRMSREEEALLKQLAEARDRVAQELSLDPGVLAPRDALRSLVRNHPRTEAQVREYSPLMHWQTEALLPELLPVLQADGITEAPLD